MTKRINTVITTTTVILLLNLFYTLFFYTKTYSTSVTITTEIEVNNPTQVWYVYKNKFSEKRFFSDRMMLLPGKVKKFQYQINTSDEIEYIGLFWNAPLKSSIDLFSYTFEINDKLFTEVNPIKIIQYTNSSSTTKSLSNGLKVTSTDSKRNWIMLNDTEYLNKLRDKKNFKPIPLLFNLFLAFTFYLFFFINNNIVNRFKIVTKKGTISRIRLTVFCLWVFLMPFWIIISHTLMAFSVVLMLVELYNKGEKFRIDYKSYIVFFLLYLGIIITSVFTSTTSQVLDIVLHYSYFLLMPFCMQGIGNKSKTLIIKWFKTGLLAYLLLLLIFTIQNYFITQPENTFLQFLKHSLELFWHTSYFSALFLIIYISMVLNPVRQHSLDILFYGLSLAFMFIISARLPFILGLLLIVIRVINSINKVWLKRILILASGVVSLMIFMSFLNITSNSDTGDINTIDARLSIWESTFVQIKENYLVGVGNENTVEVISKTINEDYKTKYRDYNAHNQFLEISLANGVLVSLLFILLFFYYCRNTGYLGKIFIAVCFVLFLVESYLQRQAGVVYFTFWAVFFSNYYIKKNEGTN